MAPKKMATTLNVAEKYQKLDPIEHVIKRPGMYVGSIEEDTIDIWVFDDGSKRMIKKNVKYVPGCYKIFDEVLVNAIDHASRLKALKEVDANINITKNIKVNISKDTGIIEVFNDGDGIDIVKHPEHGVFIPELIFGNLNSSTNYDDSEERIVGGMNGLGAKLTNIFSTWFEVETVDAVRKQHYKQRFYDNMSKKDEPTIGKYTKKPFTTVRFLPDYGKFNGMVALTDGMYEIMRKRVYDACAVTDQDVSIYFNDEKLEYKTFEKYVDLYLGDKTDHMRVFERINERWEVVASYNEFNGFEHVSFVNGINTLKAGKHVEYIVNQVTKKLIEMIGKKKKDVTVKPATIKENLFIFIKSVVVNPTFDSQSKETLTTPVSKFGSKGELSDKFIEKLYKTGIVERALEVSEILDGKKLAKTDGKKKNNIRGLPKLEDAAFAGTAKSQQCTLLLTEGDSALSTALAGLSEVNRSLYGAFPLKGKVLNTRDQTAQKISQNDEINALKKILGLETGKVYSNVDELRYGRIMLLTDQDTDASHIRALIMNLFHSLWPSLIMQPNFICSLMTPIIKMRKGSQLVQFYNLTDYENWMQNNDSKGWNIKYFKGLATSNAAEAKQYFRDMQCVTYSYTGEESDKKFDLAFNKKVGYADQRKEWLSRYDRQSILDISQKNVTYEDFIDKELIHFSTYDNSRSIPSICDGLKTSQRKIMFSCFKRNLMGKEIKVAQLAGYVSEVSGYHHGEASLNGAIVNLAQNYVASNNINLLQPLGQFGTRHMAGNDAGSPRYIFTLLNPITSTLYVKEDLDLYEYQNDDGLEVEPLWYLPIIPMLLVNGSIGIGTGFSTNIPMYNPIDIIAVIQKLLNSESIETIELKPYVKGFKGVIEKSIDNKKYVSRGIFKKISATCIQITELPAYTWTVDFKELLEEYLDKHASEVKNYISNSNDTDIDFVIEFVNSETCVAFLKVEDNGYTKFENEFKLVSSKNLLTSNMYYFNRNIQIQKFDKPEDIICDYYFVRLEFYQKRKDHMLKRLAYNIQLLENKICFIQSVANETLIVQKMTKEELIARLESDQYMLHDDSYEYMIRLPIYSITLDNVIKLEKEKQVLDGEISATQDKDIQDMWRFDLQNFMVEYDKFILPNTKKVQVVVKK